MVELHKTISQVAQADSAVLIEGETGTGKALVAYAIHRNSARAGHMFREEDCGGLPPAVVEGVLFGAMKGTDGAPRDRKGIFEAAHGGTVLLDEIGEIESDIQMRLLRYLQDHKVQPVGASESKAVDTRLIAATCRGLHTMVEHGKFRRDLWSQISAVTIRVPPLRDRRGDVPILARFFVDKYNQQYGAVQLMESGIQAMGEYSWPGNVRQLQHVIEQLVFRVRNIDDRAVHDALNDFRRPIVRPLVSYWVN